MMKLTATERKMIDKAIDSAIEVHERKITEIKIGLGMGLPSVEKFRKFARQDIAKYERTIAAYKRLKEKVKTNYKPGMFPMQNRFVITKHENGG